MSKAEEIIVERINAMDKLMDAIIDYELQTELEGIKLSDQDRKYHDGKWHEYFCIKCELVSVLTQIKGVAVDELVY